MQEFFADRKELCKIDGKSDEYIVWKRRGRLNTRFAENYIYETLLDDDTKLVNGDLVTRPDNTRYMVVARRDGYMSKIGQQQKINCIVDIYRVSGSMASGYTSTPLFTSKPSIQSTVSGNMKQFDSGLLPTTVKKFILPNIDVELTNRIKFNDVNYQINAIDDSSYENLLVCQVELDKRVIK